MLCMLTDIYMVSLVLCHSCLASQQALFLFTELLSARTSEATIQGEVGISMVQLQCPQSRLRRQRRCLP